MELENLQISRCASYTDRPNDYEGSIKFKGVYGEVKINLDNQLSRRVLEICAEAMTQATRILATHLTAETLVAANAQLEHKHD